MVSNLISCSQAWCNFPSCMTQFTAEAQVGGFCQALRNLSSVFLRALGKRCTEILGVTSSAILNCYLVYMLAKHFQPWDTIWIVMSVCEFPARCTYHMIPSLPTVWPYHMIPSLPTLWPYHMMPSLPTVWPYRVSLMWNRCDVE